MMNKKRFRLALTHFLISVCCIFPIVLLIRGVWYPNIMPTLFGTKKVVLIMVFINIVVWPALSAFLYKTDQKKLRFDLIVMGALQIIITATMVFQLWQNRPVWVVYVIDSFEITRQKDMVTDGKPIPDTFKVGIFEPFQIVGASFSSDPKIATIQKSAELDGISIAWRSAALEPLANKKDLMKKYALPVAELKKYNKENRVESVIEKYPQATHFLALKGFVTDGAILVNEDLSWFEPVVLLPWEE